MLRLFQGKLYFRRSYFFTLLQSNYFATTVTFSEQLYLQSICFFWPAPFSEQSLLRSSYCFRIATFSEQNFYRAATTWEKEVLWVSYFSEQLPFWRRNCLEWRYLQKSCYFFEAGTSAQHQLFQKSYILGEKKQFFRKAIFRITHFFGEPRFYSSYFFKRRYLL